MRLLPSLVKSAEIVVEASRLDAPVHRKKSVRTRKNQPLFLDVSVDLFLSASGCDIYTGKFML
jgi:hypothetical protein